MPQGVPTSLPPVPVQHSVHLASSPQQDFAFPPTGPWEAMERVPVLMSETHGALNLSHLGMCLSQGLYLRAAAYLYLNLSHGGSVSPESVPSSPATSTLVPFGSGPSLPLVPMVKTVLTRSPLGSLKGLGPGLASLTFISWPQ